MSLLSEPPPSVPLDVVAERVKEAVRRADAYDGRGVWIRRCAPDEIDAQLARLDGLVAERRHLPLLGLTMAVKDNIDVAGLPTTAACPAFAYTPQVSARVVQTLCDAGVVIVGKTNMDQFATGLTGTRSPHGATENFYDRRYIAGGSSGGSAVAVAAGLCDFALGTDTAGSGRVPAAFNNLVGLKPSRGLVSTAGIVPTCKSLDCVSIFTREPALARAVMEVAEGFDENDIYSRVRDDLCTRDSGATVGAFRVGVPAAEDLEFFGNAEYERLFAAACERIEATGVQRTTINYAPFAEAAGLLYDGPWVAERLAAISEFYDRHADEMLPATRQIIGASESLSAVDAFRGLYNLAACRRQAKHEWEAMDVLLLPSVGTIYTIDDVNADPIGLNRNLGYYTNFVNLLDLCALSIPAGFTDAGLPFGVTLLGQAGCEARLFDAAAWFMAPVA